MYYSAYSTGQPYREQLVARLQQAYAAGALSKEEFDRRLDQALSASHQTELSRVLQGTGFATSPAAAYLRSGQPARAASNIGSGLVHLSALVGGFVPPLVVKSLAVPGSKLWWESARAVSLQLTLFFIGIASVIVGVVFGVGELLPLAWLLWISSTVIASVRAFQGQSSIGRLAPILPFAPTQEEARAIRR